MKKTPLLAFLAIASMATAQSGHPRIQMVFTDTDAAYVLQAISKQTGESILYNNKNKVSITLTTIWLGLSLIHISEPTRPY